MTAVCGREEDIITKTTDKNTTLLKLRFYTRKPMAATN